MQELATTHWKSNSQDTSKSSHCRIQWIIKQCYDYFVNGGKDKFNQREIDIANKINNQSSVEISHRKDQRQTFNTRRNDSNEKIRVLDVGSCYNPLGDDKLLDVTAIDLAPYCDRVFQCDFLNTNIGTETIILTNDNKIEQLGQSSYDVCVFSLLLEYFPCPEQRFKCCKKAYEVLKDSGILIIITPDSKHVGANAQIMKSWRFVLSKLGFTRINYEKLQHIHCICFRKCLRKEIAVRWAEIQTLPLNNILFSSNVKIYIPQDFQANESNDTSVKIIYDTQDLVNTFVELPELIID